MKTNKSFGEWILDVFAALMRGIAPRFCVKSLTLKSRRNACKFLPGTEKELRIIHEMGEGADKLFLQNRFWSLQTRVALLKEKNAALTNDATTAAEFMAVYAMNNVELMSAVMRVYTPDRAKMLAMLNEKDATLVAQLASRVPAAFASLSAREILGVGSDEPLKADSPRWNIATALAQGDSQWTLAFMKELMQDSCKEFEMQNRFRYFFLNAVKAGENVANFMFFVHTQFPDLAADIRNAGRSYKFFARCFCTLFPQIVTSLRKDENYVLWDRGSVEKAGEVVKWLHVGLYFGDKDIDDCLISQVKVLCKRLSESNVETLLDRFCSIAWKPYHFHTLLPLVKDENKVKQLHKRFVSISDGRGGLSSYFPFKEWVPETAKAAVASMVNAKTLPVERLKELSPELFQYAVCTMECATQIEAIRQGKAHELVSLTSLYPKAERELLIRGDKSSRLLYVQNFKMHASTFLYLLNELTKSPVYEELLCAHAEKWGLTEAQYYALMQSKYCDHAPFLAAKVCKAE